MLFEEVQCDEVPAEGVSANELHLNCVGGEHIINNPLGLRHFHILK
jgi:hypothetical protein